MLYANREQEGVLLGRVHKQQKGMNEERKKVRVCMKCGGWVTEQKRERGVKKEEPTFLLPACLSLWLAEYCAG